MSEAVETPEFQETQESLVFGLKAGMERHLGLSAEIEGLTRLSGGASQETHAFDALVKGERQNLILRRSTAPSMGAMTQKPSNRAESDLEAKVLQAVKPHGVPVPGVEWILTPEDGLGQGFVMTRIEGETLAPKILKEPRFEKARGMMAGQCGEILARLHQVPFDEAPKAMPLQTPQIQLETYTETLDRMAQPQPALELGLRWLKQNMPEAGPHKIVHGDFRNGNLIVGEEGIRAVLDWELTHQGDPMEDLGWLCVRSWRFSRPQNPVGGFGSREALFESYQRAGGGTVDPQRVKYWEVFGNVKWGIMCLIQAFRHLSGDQRSVELAAIGRRVEEPSYDLLQLIS